MKLFSFLKIIATTFVFVISHFFVNAQTTVTDVFDVPGNYNFVVPCDVYMITVRVYGGGGGGGGSNGNGGSGGGGGAGGYCTRNVFTTPGTVIPYRVGVAGAAGTSVSNGGNGGFSSWDGATVSWGGQGGKCLLNFSSGGVTGLPPTGFGTTSGAAVFINGDSGMNGGPITGGAGGTAYGPEGGAGGVAGAQGVPGGNGNNYGAGGGGGGSRVGPTVTDGGAGGAGAVVVTYTVPWDLPNAGLDVSTCNVIFLQGNAPSAGWTGTWSIISGVPVIADINDPNSLITIPTPGTCAVVRWTFSQPGCLDRFDDVSICYPAICNDDPCGAIALPVSTSGCSPSVYTNIGATGSTGMVEPGCGDYGGNDVWYSAVVPANGTISFTTGDAPGGLAMKMGIAVYEGPNCGNLSHQGCDFATSSADIAQITYSGVPGSTVYIRIWDFNDAEGSYDLCAFTHTNPPGDVLEGTTVVPCASGGIFFDPGGNGGNYSNNSSTHYVICPDTPGQYLTIDFTTGANFFTLETGGSDYLAILDGGGDTTGIIGQWSGTSNPGIITSSAPDGCLTLVFQSDVAINAAGWQASISCTSIPGVNDTICEPSNCSGLCGQWVCQDGLYPTENNGNAIQDFASNTAGCLDPTAGEIASHWFYFTALTTGTLEFSFAGPNGQDYNLAVWGPSTNGVPPCPMNTGDAPILCSQADVTNTGNPVGLSGALGAGQSYEGPEGDGWITSINAIAGDTYAMMLNIFQNGNPQPVIDMTIGGSGTLDCTPIAIQLPVTLSSFAGINQGDHNLVTWITNSEQNNDYFTIERSINGFDWEFVATVQGAGNSIHSKYYELIDNDPNFPISYYRLSQTDYDGESEFFNVISVNGQKPAGDFVSALFPNPTEDYATFMYNGFETDQMLTVQFLNEIGNVVLEYKYKVYTGMPATIRTDDLAYGLYHVVFTQGNERSVQKLSIIR